MRLRIIATYRTRRCQKSTKHSIRLHRSERAQRRLNKSGIRRFSLVKQREEERDQWQRSNLNVYSPSRQPFSSLSHGRFIENSQALRINWFLRWEYLRKHNEQISCYKLQSCSRKNKLFYVYQNVSISARHHCGCHWMSNMYALVYVRSEIVIKFNSKTKCDLKCCSSLTQFGYIGSLEGGVGGCSSSDAFVEWKCTAALATFCEF